jgi:hypothetical protein
VTSEAGFQKDFLTCRIFFRFRRKNTLWACTKVERRKKNRKRRKRERKEKKRKSRKTEKEENEKDRKKQKM